MIQFRLCPLDKAEASTESLACWELVSFFLGSSSPRDLELDVDPATAWYLENKVAVSDRADYSAEPELVEGEMLDQFESSLSELVSARQNLLGEHYPFELKPRRVLTRKSDSDITLVGLAYLSLQFFRAQKRGYIEFSGETEADIRRSKKYFGAIFQRTFELLASYAVSIHQGGTPYLLSDCRGYIKLHGRLTKICKRIGSGEVLTLSQWNIAQKAANDGGVDCLVHVGAPNTTGTSHLVVLGVTVQEEQITIKIIGADSLQRFSTFFSQKPAGFQGALARPQDEDALTKMYCIDKNCLLYTYSELLNIIGKEPSEQLLNSREYRIMQLNLRDVLSKLESSSFLYDYAQHSAFPI